MIVFVFILCDEIINGALAKASFKIACFTFNLLELVVGCLIACDL